ncbi:helix-turn-helix transcriptional regulator [Pseudomonas sp.]|uniref:helix-turn-helix domain-containing protein n=1 Tax=Pseudomonas sp. TaxID=306 RepID=UPI002899D915|nr:helix-turn-helix transcriptional regulator [Pseudomonas sp.]
MSGSVQGTSQKDLLRKVQRGFGSNLLRAMQVADFSKEGEPKKLTQERLAKASGVARSTISKYLAQQIDVNPDMETICRLASALNVSPALLLMSDEDWLRLAHATSTVAEAKNDGLVNSIIGELGSSANSKPTARASAVLKLSKHFGYKDTAPQDETYRRILRGILGTAAMPVHPSFNRGAYMNLLPLCVVMGARIVDQGQQA